MGQQVMPRPTLAEARTIGNVVRRAKQFKDMCWSVLLHQASCAYVFTLFHTDAAFGHEVKVHRLDILSGSPIPNFKNPWAPALWKSYRLKRVVRSTFAGETQALSDGLGHAEWLGCRLAV